MTNGRRDYDFPRVKVTIRDAIIAGLAVAGMWGLQTREATKTQNAIENLGTKVDGYMVNQSNINSSVEREIADARTMAKLAIVNDAETAKELAELKGYLTGAGLKGMKR